jgi:hypothetical protein|tara:strand:+ start:566 stop:844 length:279 start_codon:yes stop_codon:yes gene_type:complete
VSKTKAVRFAIFLALILARAPSGRTTFLAFVLTHLKKSCLFLLLPLNISASYIKPKALFYLHDSSPKGILGILMTAFVPNIFCNVHGCINVL